MRGKLTRRLHRWLHRKGIARVLNYESNSFTPQHRTGYVEVCAPRQLVQPLARWTVINGPYWNGGCKPVLNSFTFDKTADRLGKFTYRIHLKFKVA